MSKKKRKTIIYVDPRVESQVNEVRNLLIAGKTVTISPTKAVQTPARHQALSAATPGKSAWFSSLNQTDIVTALSGGAALSVAALTIAPASVVAASAAAVAGVVLGGLAKKLDHHTQIPASDNAKSQTVEH